MLKNLIKNKAFNLFESYKLNKLKDIEYMLQKRALIQTVEYIEANLQFAKAFNSKYEIFEYIFKNIDINEDGHFMEFGVYKGETINFLSKLRPQIKYHGFDSFEGLPEYWREGFEKNTFNLNGNLPKVNSNVILHKGWFDKTLPDFLKNHPNNNISFLHIDCDLYSSTKTIFALLENLICKNTVIVFDEYFNYPKWKDNEFKAFQEFVTLKKIEYKYICYNQKHEQVAIQIL